MLVAINLRAPITGVGPVVDVIGNDHELTSAMSALLVSLPLLCFAGVSWLVPAMLQRIGMQSLMTVSLLFIACGILVRSATTFGSLWWGTLLIGVGVGSLNVALPTFVRGMFPSRVASITGTYTAVQAGLAAVAAAIVVPLSAGFGWRLSLLPWAVPAGLAAVIAFFALQRSGPERSAHAPAPVGGPVTTPRFSPWRTCRGWYLSLVMGLQSAIFYSVITWWSSIQTAAGTSHAAAAANQAALQLCGVVGSLVAAALLRVHLEDQRRVLVILMPLPPLALVAELLWPQVPVVWSVILGFGCTANLVLAVTLVTLRAKSAARTSAFSGMANTLGYLLAAVGPICTGWLHDVSGSWMLPVLTIPVIFVIQITVGFKVAKD